MSDRIFRADDGTELHEEDIRLLTCKAWTRHELDNDVPVAEERIRSALDGPQTCGALLGGRWACVLPAGHHPFVLSPERCAKWAADPIHSPGHCPAPETWSES